jgi:hypothetical protein
MVSHLIVNQAGEVVGSYNFLDVRLLAMLASALVPLLVNLITKQTASDGLRAVANIVATAVLTVLALWINPGSQPITVWLALNTFLFSLGTSFTAYKGVWKPTGVSGSITAKTPNLGLGSPPTVQTPSKGQEDVGQVDNEPNA